MATDVSQIMGNARQSVIGVLTARTNDDAPGASLVISSFLKDSKAAGYGTNQAWAQLFAAAVLLVIPLLECRASHHEEGVDDVLHELALIMAEYGNG